MFLLKAIIISVRISLKCVNYKPFFNFQQNDDDGGCDTKQVVRKGILWHQRDKLFSRWKERFFILTKDYFHCFKKDVSKLSEMGEFLFKVSTVLQMILVQCIKSNGASSPHIFYFSPKVVDVTQ